MYKAFERPKTIAAPSGSPMAVTYSLKMDKNGRKYLVESGVTNVYELIQADLESSLIENIVRRVTEGDLSVFRTEVPVYADVTEMPKTLAEAQNLVEEVKDQFSKLPKEVREKFNNSAEAYVAEYGSEKWAQAVGLMSEVFDEKVAEAEEKKEVKADEQK